MPIFVSYSHTDSAFVDRLAGELVNNNASIWLDRWELSVGDSILEKVQAAIEDASALLVVLSRASIESPWCSKELDAGLLRELEEKRVVVMPCLLEDCQVPVFLRGKLYADFRQDFGRGLNDVIAAIAKVTSDVRGRVHGTEWYFDFAIDWWFEDGIRLRLLVVEQHVNQPFTVLTEMVITPNAAAAERYQQYQDAGLDWIGRQMILEAVSQAFTGQGVKVLLEDQTPHRREVRLRDQKLGYEYTVVILMRWLGEDSGNDLLFNVAQQLTQVNHLLRSRARTPDRDELEQLLELVQRSPEA